MCDFRLQSVCYWLSLSGMKVCDSLLLIDLIKLLINSHYSIILYKFWRQIVNLKPETCNFALMTFLEQCETEESDKSSLPCGKETFKMIWTGTLSLYSDDYLSCWRRLYNVERWDHTYLVSIRMAPMSNTVNTFCHRAKSTHIISLILWQPRLKIKLVPIYNQFVFWEYY